MKRKGFFWHLHHDIPIEWTWDVRERIAYIKCEKSRWEVPRRLALIRPLKGDKVPESPNAIQRLHSIECGCPFFKQGFDIFSLQERANGTAPRLPRGMKSPKTPRKPAKPGKGQKRKPTPPCK